MRERAKLLPCAHRTSRCDREPLPLMTRRARSARSLAAIRARVYSERQGAPIGARLVLALATWIALLACSGRRGAPIGARLVLALATWLGLLACSGRRGAPIGGRLVLA